MTDTEKREKVIRGLESCLRLCDYNACRECPYGDGTPCKLLHDALALLKEQDEGVTPIESTTEQKKFADRIGFAVSEFWCGACRFNLVGHPKFCPNCGKKVKWNV